jgi:uncharacterized integral membrane protein
MKLTFIAALVVAALAAFFAVQNSQESTVTFMGWYFEAPLVIVLLITFAAGALTAMLLMFPASLKKSLEIKRLKALIPPSPPAEGVGGSLEPGSRPPGPGEGRS